MSKIVKGFYEYDWSAKRDDQRLITSDRIIFRFADGREIEIDEDNETGGIEIRGMGGCSTLVLSPRAANVVRVNLEDRQ